MTKYADKTSLDLIVPIGESTYTAWWRRICYLKQAVGTEDTKLQPYIPFILNSLPREESDVLDPSMTFSQLEKHILGLEDEKEDLIKLLSEPINKGPRGNWKLSMMFAQFRNRLQKVQNNVVGSAWPCFIDRIHREIKLHIVATLQGAEPDQTQWTQLDVYYDEWRKGQESRTTLIANQADTTTE